MTQPPYGPPADPYSGPVSGEPYSTAYPTYPGPYPVAYPPVAPPRKRRTGLIVTLVVVLALVLCGAGSATAFLLVERGKPKGTSTAEEAVNGFLTAVFTSHDAAKAGEYVCENARDSGDLTALVNQVAEFERQYESPKTTWRAPQVAEGAPGEAAATVELRFSTGDERAAEKKIRLLLVRDGGWWVCDVEPA